MGVEERRPILKYEGEPNSAAKGGGEGEGKDGSATLLKEGGR